MLELREFYRQQRGNTFQVSQSNLKGIDELFGARGSTYPVQVRIKSMAETFVSVNLFEVSIELYEEAN